MKTLSMIVLALCTACVPAPKTEPVVAKTETTALVPTVVEGKPSFPTLIYLDPGKKLDRAEIVNGHLRWTTREANPKETFVTYETRYGESVVVFVEQKAR